MRTDAEIVARIRERQQPFERDALMVYLPYEQAKEFLRPDVTEKHWQESYPFPRDSESILARITKYMPFAWNKANGARAEQAARSMSLYSAWMWLLGEDPGDLKADQDHGKDNLVAICNRYGMDAKQWDVRPAAGNGRG